MKVDFNKAKFSIIGQKAAIYLLLMSVLFLYALEYESTIFIVNLNFFKQTVNRNRNQFVSSIKFAFVSKDRLRNKICYSTEKLFIIL